MLILGGCAGTTAVQSTHPLLARQGATDSARVYIIRPDPGFRGVMDMPVTISLGGSELLTLAKGQYTLMHLTATTADLKAESHTVVGTTNTMTKVSSNTLMTFSAGATHYLVFELVPRGGLAGSAYLPRPVSREGALEAVQGLTPVGVAAAEPIAK